MADDGDQSSGLSPTQTVRLVALGGLVLASAALALDNRQEVSIGWVAGDTSAPLALALALAFVLGLAVGWLSARWR